MVEADNAQLNNPSGDQVLPSGSIIHWGDRDLVDSRKRGVTCGGCREHRYTRPYLDRPRWTGLCTKCSDTSRRKGGDEVHSSGSIIHRGDRDPEDSQRIAVTCFHCGRRDFDSIKTVTTPKWSGRCYECRHMKHEDEEAEPSPAKPLGCGCELCVALLARAVILPQWNRDGALNRDVTHPSKTIVHQAWRDPEDPHWRFLITCHGCGHFSFTQKSNIKNPKWYGLCPDCIAKFGKPKGRSKYAGKQILRQGAKVDWDAPHLRPGAALVECRNFSQCGHTVERIVNANNKDHQPFYCDPCLREQRSAGLKAAWSALKNGQKNGGVEKRVGAKQRRRDEWLLEAITKIADIWKRVREYEHFPREKQIGLITLPLLADKCGVGDSKAPDTAAKQMSNRLDACGVRDMFFGSRRWYESFREAVVELIEGGKPAEEIVSSLKSLHSRSRSAA